MKQKFLILMTFGLLGFSNMYAQTVNDVLIKDIDVQYVEIIGSHQPLSNKFTVEIDFGQLDKLFISKDLQVKDENGEIFNFNSMIDALNFLGKNGFKLVSAYAVLVGDRNVYHYILEKK